MATIVQAGWPWVAPIQEALIMGQAITIRRAGNLMEVSCNGTDPLPPDLRNVLEPRLTYTYQKFLRGPDRIDPITGYDRGPMKFEECRLYRYDGKGRFCCGIGFMSKIVGLLRQASCAITVIDCNPVHPRPDRFKEDWNTVADTFNFRAKQDDCLAAISAHEYGVIKAPTGFGKGVMIAMGCLLYPNAKIHVITPSKDLVEKTVAVLTRFVPMVGQVGCGKKRVGRVTVYSADSLHLSDGDADIVFADEIHMLAATTYSAELAKYRYSRNYGFSATPTGRMDGADAKLESLFGPIIFSLPYPEAVKLGLVVPIKVEWLDIRISPNPCEGKKEVAKKRWGIWRNEQRNEAIANKALSYADEDQVLILVETIEHLLFLRQHLPGFQACYSEHGMSSKELEMYRRWTLMAPDEEPLTTKQREALRKGFERGEIKKAIATKVWATGVDFEQLAVLIRADAMGSAIMDVQAPGRVSRIYTQGQKGEGIVVDCQDQFDDGFRRKALSRKKTYEAQGWEQVLVKRTKREGA